MNFDSLLTEVESSLGTINHEFFRQKNLTLTGSSGLIGTYLLAYFYWLNQLGYDVKLTSISRSEPPEYLAKLIEQAGMTHLTLDLTDFDQYQYLPSADIVIHGAGYAQPTLFMANPAATLTINVAATLALLKAVDRNGTFIFLSSSEIYCGALAEICTEDTCGTTTPYHPRSSYIEGKRAGEAACAAYRTKGIRTISLRLGDIYGPGTRKHDQRALNSFIEQALVTGQINLRDQGTAMRTYSYVTDAVESILNILTQGQHPVYNVGGPTFTSIKELAHLIGKLTSTPVNLPIINNQIAGSPPVLNIDMTRLNFEFNKSNHLSLLDGLTRTIAWQQQMYSKVQ